MDATIGTGSATSYVAPKTVKVPVEPPVVQPPKPPSADQQSSSGSDTRDQRREMTPDATTGAMVFRIVEVATGAVTMQTPTDARLKLRAYIDGVFFGGSSGFFGHALGLKPALYPASGLRHVRTCAP